MVKIIKQKLQFEKSLKQRLEFICEFSKVTPTFITGSHRSEFERLKKDIKTKKIDTILALKLDRITRSIFDW